MEQIIVACPFCEKPIKAIHYPEVVRTIRKHTATFGSRTHYIRTKEKYEVYEDCPHCGKSKKEIQKALNGDMPAKPKPKEEVRKQLEELGLLNRFEKL